MKTLRPCLVITGALLFLVSVLYPAVVTASAQAIFQGRANGSLVVEGGAVRGSALIGQSVAEWTAHPEYLWGRPSAASNDASSGVTSSSGSNYGPLNASLSDEVKARVETLRATGVTGPIPADLVTKSASGLDPHISPAAAELQVPRLAKTRGLGEAKVREIIAAHTESSTLGILGEPRVNVLLVNLAFDRIGKVAPPAPAPKSSAAP